MKKLYAILISLALTGCQAPIALQSTSFNAFKLTPAAQTVAKSSVTVIAHRGGASWAPENTLPAFQKSIDRKVEFLEIDVRLTKDKQVVIMHDADVDRTTNGKGDVEDLTLAQIKNLDAGSKFSSEYKNTRVPTLEEVLSLCKDKIKVYVEIKHEDAIPQTVELIKKYNMVDKVVVMSFTSDHVIEAKRLEPGLVTAKLFAIPPVTSFEKIKSAYKVSQVIFLSKLLFNSMVESAHKASLGIMSYTVDEADTAQKLISWKLDGIITNKPDMVMNLLNTAK